MTTVKGSCPTCGDVQMTSDDVLVMHCDIETLSYYVFRCPSCRVEVRKPADAHVISLLMSGGSRIIAWRVPAEALERHTGPPITFDDVLDFVLYELDHIHEGLSL